MRVITLASLALALAASAIPLAIRADSDVSSQGYASLGGADAEGIVRDRRLGVDSGSGSISAESLTARGVQDGVATEVDASRESTPTGGYSFSSSTAGGATPQPAEKTKPAVDSLRGADSVEHDTSHPLHAIDGGKSDTGGVLAEAAGVAGSGVGTVDRAGTIIPDEDGTSAGNADGTASGLTNGAGGSEKGVAGGTGNAVDSANVSSI